ncbi:hypothetical protein [Pseudoxanthomonas sp. PXM01]|uniref:hypothetical protein n=1 Tax=Pseudoxanthomonas sp. PXM01 TaxID=2769295 RepID=UPI00177F7659|nr:hypothetical protein [Pseudoxanthomonas sp. PXM01]MBD9468591.1 hypothetical protein [Pseudoxanthomonas sp. PXM01]
MDEVAIGTAVDAMYAMISGPAGPRDWSTQEAAFHPDCRQIRTGVDAEGKPWRLSFTLAEYRANADELLAKMDFFEVETAREVRVFGNIAHVWSAYEARTAPDDAVPERRGINSIQLYKGEDGWKIIHMIWDNERDGVPLPAVG